MTEHQPETDPQINVTTTPEEQAKRDEYRRRLAEALKDPTFAQSRAFRLVQMRTSGASDPPLLHRLPQSLPAGDYRTVQQDREEIRQKLGLKEEKYQA
jgi:crotonobetainyl-CoA:carnitine CoA-transferase CaiB-like acyl-CoA transferase